jgi:hypothetical protein
MKSLINIGEAEWRGHTGLEALWIMQDFELKFAFLSLP